MTDAPDLLGQIPIGALTDGEAAALIAWAERFAARRVAAERERWARRVEDAFYEGFTSPETYNDTLQNSADEAWAKAKASLLKA